MKKKVKHSYCEAIATVAFFIVMVLFWISVLSVEASAKAPRSKFYDFNQQLIDGEVRKPTALFTDRKDKVKFDRLLNLKKSFLPQLMSSAKEKVFK